MNEEILALLTGTDSEFAQAMVALGWFQYPPTLTDHPFRGRARAALNPRFRRVGQVPGTGAWIYRLALDSHRWQDAVAVAESQFRAEPQFAVVFVTLPRCLLILAPEDLEKAGESAGAARMAQVFLDTARPGNFEADVLRRLKQARAKAFRARLQEVVNVERVTRAFYDQFKDHRDKLVGFIEGIERLEDRQWYASVILNRLMFIYFIQVNGVLDRDPSYLRTRLRAHSHSPEGYYRDFLCPLFFRGFATPVEKRDPETRLLLGDIPYLNGGLFMPHQLEERNPDIRIDNDAFGRLYDFFDGYTWHIDDRPLSNERQVNPDVLGYIFEKFVNQKQMGAYYTKEDITGYICRNTIIPRLLDMLESGSPASAAAVHPLPITDIDRYVYPAVKHGAHLELPAAVAAGIDDVSQRGGWNEAAPPEFALPTETWRELVARRQRYLGILQDFKDGRITTANDFITYNLDLPRLALDFIRQIQDAALLRDLYFRCIQRVTVLDPTCGSGAFLFAALNILYPLYEACLDRMEELESGATHEEPITTMKGEFAFANDVDDQLTFLDPSTLTDEVLRDFRAELDRIAAHPNRSYYIHKTILVNNLYGVDIMEEAVEICKLRLFLNLISHADPDSTKPNQGIEPLPDIDFNILAGNTLVGYTTIEDIDRQWKTVEEEQGTLAFEKDHSKLKMLVGEYAEMLRQFRAQQLGEELNRPLRTKADVLRACELVRPDLDTDLWRLYRTAGKLADKVKLKEFEATHQPFHWFLGFPHAMANGGFDVVVGNPPYVEYSKVRSSYQISSYATERAGNLYAFAAERAVSLLVTGGWSGLVLQQPVVSTQRMEVVREFYSSICAIVLSCTFDDRPSKLFDGMHHARIAILLGQRRRGREKRRLFVTGYNKWYREERDGLFAKLSYTEATQLPVSYYPKIRSALEARIVQCLEDAPGRFTDWMSAEPTEHRIYYKITGVGHWFTVTLRPPRFVRGGKDSASSRQDSISFADVPTMNRAFALLNSTLFYWFYQVRTNCRDFNPSDYRSFPLVPSLILEDFSWCADALQAALDGSSRMGHETNTLSGDISVERFSPRAAKPVIDVVDRVLCRHFNLDDEALDFIINYDIKYRVGGARGADGER